jgi:hypothetical protein
MKTHNFDKSSFIKCCVHDPDKNVMSITFGNGKTYHYGDCGHDDYDKFTKADSPGKHFANVIKGKKGIYQP